MKLIVTRVTEMRYRHIYPCIVITHENSSLALIVNEGGVSDFKAILFSVYHFVT